MRPTGPLGKRRIGGKLGRAGDFNPAHIFRESFAKINLGDEYFYPDVIDKLYFIRVKTVMVKPRSYIAFEDSTRIATGDLQQVAMKVKETMDLQPAAAVLVFNSETSEVVELDLRGTLKDVLRKLTPTEKNDAKSGEQPPQGRGRPKLGVVAREVTLLPRHWDWLNRQSGGASVALRKLVEEALRTHSKKDQVETGRAYAYRFMSVMAGDLPGFEEAARALFSGNELQFNAMVASWPADVQGHAKELAAATFTTADE